MFSSEISPEIDYSATELSPLLAEDNLPGLVSTTKHGALLETSL
jgi:hypothetical protein